jgi:Bacteriophage baseplate protein W
MQREFLGSGWTFPPQVNSRGGISLSRDARDIDEAIRIVLSTMKGERPMRPTFGSDIHLLVFAPNNASTASTLSRYCEEALAMWEPRIDVLSVNVDTNVENEGVMLVNIRYRIRASNDERNLVYPFYRIPPEE